MSITSVYALIDPLNNSIEKPLYVGETDNMPRRFVEHLTYKGHNLGLNAHIANLALAGYVPICKILETVEGDKKLAHARERYHIVTLNPLYNL